MKPIRRYVVFTLACAGFLLGFGAADAACRLQVNGSRCVTAGSGFDAGDGAEAQDAGLSGHFKKASGPKSVPDSPSFAPGDRLPDDYTVLFNRSRYDLPAPRDGWTYFRVGYEIYRADMFTRIVIDRVNDHMSVRY